MTMGTGKPASVLLLCVGWVIPPTCHGQSKPVIQVVPHAPPERPVVQVVPALSEQQRQVCGAYQQFSAQYEAYNSAVAAAVDRAKGNPLALRAIRVARPDSDAPLRTRMSTIMGKGSFQNWAGTVKIELGYQDQVILTFSFSCKWQEYEFHSHMYESIGGYTVARSHDSLSFGGVASPGVSADSELGKSLAVVVPGESMLVTGRLFCASTAATIGFSGSGCAARSDRDPTLSATITGMRSVRTGANWKFPDTRNRGISFNLSDNFEILREKARNAGGAPLSEYLDHLANRSLSPVTWGAGASSFYVHVLGDLPALIGHPPLQKPMPFPGKDDYCYIVKPDDQAALENTAKEMDRILDSLFDAKLFPAAVKVDPNPCLDVAGNQKPYVGPKRVYTVGNDVTAPIPITKPDPVYPKGAVGTGEALLEIVIDETGKPDDVKVTRGLGEPFDQLAIEAVQKWRFRPGRKGGVPVPVSAKISVQFSDRSSRKLAFVAPVSENAPSEPHTVKLTPDSPSADRSATIAAPGNGQQNYNVYYIDTRDFVTGGVLVMEIQIARESGTDGSFDLYPPNVRIPTQGPPNGAVAGRHDVAKGSQTEIEYQFAKGELFALGLSGNWFSEKGKTGKVYLRVSVRR